MEYVIGIDLGTSSLKCLLLSAAGKTHAISSASYRFSSPQNGYAEQDPEIWWQALVHALADLLERSGIEPKTVRALSFSGQMHGLVALDGVGNVVRPAILHLDTRSSDQVQALAHLIPSQVQDEALCNPYYTGFLLPSLLWVREHEPENFERIRRVFLPKDYLIYRLSGEFASDFSDASGSLAFDLKRHVWSDAVARACALDSKLFPPLYMVGDHVGEVSPEAARVCGLAAGTPVVMGGGDQIMQGIGNGAIRIGDACVNIGSSGQVSLQTDRPVPSPRKVTNVFCAANDRQWVAVAAMMNAGLSLAWLMDLLAGTDYEAMNQAVEVLPPGSHGLLFLPYLSGERTPYFQSNLSAAFFGLTPNTQAPALARAVMEGVAFALREGLDLITELAGLAPDILIASGGAARSPVWLQIQADILGIPLRLSEVPEQAGFGAALAAAVAAGFYGSLEEACEALVRYRPELITPCPAHQEIYREYYDLYRELAGQTLVVNEKLTELGRRA